MPLHFEIGIYIMVPATPPATLLLSRPPIHPSHRPPVSCPEWGGVYVYTVNSQDTVFVIALSSGRSPVSRTVASRKWTQVRGRQHKKPRSLTQKARKKNGLMTHWTGWNLRVRLLISLHKKRFRRSRLTTHGAGWTI